MIQKNDESWSRMHYEQFIATFIAEGHKEPHFELEDVIENVKILERFSLDKKRIFCLFYHPKYFFVYISKNILEQSGYSSEEIYRRGLYMAFTQIHWKQITFALKASQWGLKFQKMIGKNVSVLNAEAFFCGVKLKDKWGKWRTFMLKQKFLKIDKNNQPILSFIEAEEISNIYKADFLWTRMTNIRNGEKFCRVYCSNGSKKEYNDLLSPRELEILELVIQQRSSKEIGELLGISKNTVERHRKNMIARAGVIDMTALIHVCQMCQLI